MATLGEQAVGNIVKMNMDGVATDFIVVQQGLPSTKYDSSCDGTWLMIKNVYESIQWNVSARNAYGDSDIHYHLSIWDTYFNKFDSEIRKSIKEVKIPYTNGTGSSTIQTGSNGLSAKLFLLSRVEINMSSTSSEGSILSYFSGATSSKRIAYDNNGTATMWWTRSPYRSNTTQAYLVDKGGSSGTSGTTNQYGLRFALILPTDMKVNDDGFVVSPKAINGSISVNKLPSGYKQLEYIESTGTQYIDTGFKPKNTTRVVMDFYMNNSSNSAQFVFGAMNADGLKRYDFLYDNGSLGTIFLSIHYTYASGNYWGWSQAATGRHLVDKNGTTTTLNGTAGTITSDTTFVSDYNMYLGASNHGGTATAEKLIGYIYSCAIYDDGTLVRDYIPCKDPSGNVGLYDLVNNMFYGNAGTGTFTAGKDTTLRNLTGEGYINIGGTLHKLTASMMQVNGIFKILGGLTSVPDVNVALPSGYTKLNYIESTGTQYIDTEYRVQSENLKIVTQFMPTEIQAWKALWGCEYTDDGPWSLTPLVNSDLTLTFYSGLSKRVGSIPITTGTVYSMTCQSNNNVLTYDCNGTTGSLSTSGSMSKADNIYIFTLNSATDDNILGQASKMRMYSFKIYDNETLVRNFVPCMNPSGAVGMYDSITKKFYANSGTGTFGTGFRNTEYEPI